MMGSIITHYWPPQLADDGYWIVALPICQGEQHIWPFQCKLWEESRTVEQAGGYIPAVLAAQKWSSSTSFRRLTWEQGGAGHWPWEQNCSRSQVRAHNRLSEAEKLLDLSQYIFIFATHQSSSSEINESPTRLADLCLDKPRFLVNAYINQQRFCN